MNWRSLSNDSNIFWGMYRFTISPPSPPPLPSGIKSGRKHYNFIDDTWFIIKFLFFWGNRKNRTYTFSEGLKGVQKNHLINLQNLITQKWHFWLWKKMKIFCKFLQHFFEIWILLARWSRKFILVWFLTLNAKILIFRCKRIVFFWGIFGAPCVLTVLVYRDISIYTSEGEGRGKDENRNRSSRLMEILFFWRRKKTIRSTPLSPPPLPHLFGQNGSLSTI